MKRIQNIKYVIDEYKSITIIFFIFILLLLIYFNFVKNEKIDQYKLIIEKQYQTQFDMNYKNFMNLSQNTFYGIINKEEVYNSLKNSLGKTKDIQQLNRDKLYKYFLSDYNRLLNFGFNKIHFHFPDNKSFLRMDKPSLYGDDLTSIRLGVVKANKTLKPINGFEIGKVVDGFRFIYPIHDQNLLHIGSVEVSVPSDYFEDNFEEIYSVDCHFILNKEIAKKKMLSKEYQKYTTSSENNHYMINENKDSEYIHYSSDNFYSQNDLVIIKKHMLNGDRFTLFKKDNQNYILVQFMPVSNIEGIKNSAYFVIYSKSEYIGQVYRSFYNLLLVLCFIVLLFIYYIYYKYNKMNDMRQRELILSQQSKMASMGEMIGNIAHQWRQPLNVISTAASGMQIQKEYGLLTDEEFLDNTNSIIRNTKYLTKTIDDFRNYFKANKEKVLFNIKDVIVESIDIFGSSFKTNNIILTEDIDDIDIVSYPNELKQVIVNLLKNAKDIIEKDGLIVISGNKKNNKIFLNIKDSGGGVDDQIIDKIFEPYFTTKHQSQGTGIGLYMSYEIITKNLNGRLTVKNEEFEYNFKYYKGASFLIELDIDKLGKGE